MPFALDGHRNYRQERKHGVGAGRMASLLAAIVAGLAGCVATGGTASLADQQRVVIEGVVASVDTAPMAYDGDALVMVKTATHGAVTVHLPARRNLCKAQGLDLLAELAAGDRVRVSGTATGTGDVSVCVDAADRIQRIH